MADLLADFFPSKFLRAVDVPQAGVVVTIDRLAAEEVGRERRKAAVLYVRNLRPLILNRGNAENLVASLGTSDYQAFPGRRIVLRRVVVEFDGKQMDSVRIDPAPAPGRKPQPAVQAEPEESEDDEGWVDA